MEMTDEQQSIASELFACDDSADDERLVVRFDPARLMFWRGDSKTRHERNCLPATILHYKESVNRTPTGGRYRAQRMTVRIAGKVWIGQTKNGTDVVRLRPVSAMHPTVNQK